jgi:hypothetical protein
LTIVFIYIYFVMIVYGSGCGQTGTECNTSEDCCAVLGVRLCIDGFCGTWYKKYIMININRYYIFGNMT